MSSDSPLTSINTRPAAESWWPSLEDTGCMGLRAPSAASQVPGRERGRGARGGFRARLFDREHLVQAGVHEHVAHPRLHLDQLELLPGGLEPPVGLDDDA